MATKTTGSGEAAAETFILRGPRPGDIGWSISRQAAFYTDLFGWDGGFEALLCKISSDFLNNFDPAYERCWIAEQSGRNVGCIFLVRQSEDVAQLRMLYVEPDAQGHGIGRRLVGECVAEARRMGYGRIVLWTNAELPAARKLYESAGFRLETEDQGQKFGKDFHGQEWGLDLS